MYLLVRAPSGVLLPYSRDMWEHVTKHNKNNHYYDWEVVFESADVKEVLRYKKLTEED